MLRHLAALFCLVLAALTLGCAGSGPTADNVSQEVLDADYNACEQRAYVSTALAKSADEASETRQNIIDACMKEKGYRVK